MVLDAGTVGGVDAAAVEAALIDPEQVPWPTVDGRLNCFARLTLAEMTEAAEAAVAPPPETEGDADADEAAPPAPPADDAEDEPPNPWKEVQLRMIASREAHEASEDPNKGTWTLDAHWKHELFKAKSEVDREAFRIDLARRRRRALKESTEKLAAAEEEMRERAPKLEAAQKAHEAALEAGEEPPPPEEPNPPPEEEGGEPPPAPESALQEAQWAYDKVSARLTEWRARHIAAKNDVQAPCRATRAYVLQSDLGGTGADNVDALSELAAGGFPIRACVQVARAKWAPPTPDFFEKPADAGDDWTAPEAPTPEPDDAPGKLTAKFIEARAAAIAARDWDHGCRKIACLHAQFPRDAESLDPASMAAFAAEYCGYLAVADIEYQRWLADDASLSHVPGITPAEIDATDVRVYGQLLAGVPHERATCAVVLDAMIGQVCASATVEAIGEDDLRKARDDAAAVEAAAAIAEALGGVKLASLHDAGSLSVTTTTIGAATATTHVGFDSMGGTTTMGGATTMGGTTTMGGATTMGSTMGGTVGGGAATAGGVLLMQNGDSATTLRATYGPGLFARALRGDTVAPLASVVRLDPDEVEARMSRLLARACAGADRTWMPATPELDDDGYGARKTALRTFLPTPETPLQVLERHEMLTEAANTLPPGLFEEHGAEVRGRRHWEPLTREAYANLYSNAKRDLRGERRLYHAPEDALVTLLHAPAAEEDVDATLQRAIDFREFMERYQNAVASRKADEAEARRLEAKAEAARIAAEEEAARLLAESSMLTDEEEEEEEADGEPPSRRRPRARARGARGGGRGHRLRRRRGPATRAPRPPRVAPRHARPGRVQGHRDGHRATRRTQNVRVPAVRFARFYRRRRDDVGRGRRGYAGFPARGARRDAGGGDRRVHLNHARARAAPARARGGGWGGWRWGGGWGGGWGTDEETREPLLDENGVPVVDAEGNPVYAEPTPPPPPPPPPISLQYLTPSGLCVQVSTERTVTQKKPEVDAARRRGREGGDREGGRRRQV